MLVELGDRLRQLRQDKHLNQDQAAKLVGVEQSTISAYECDLRQPSYAVLVRLAEIYHVSTAQALNLRGSFLISTAEMLHCLA